MAVLSGGDGERLCMSRPRVLLLMGSGPTPTYAVADGRRNGVHPRLLARHRHSGRVRAGEGRLEPAGARVRSADDAPGTSGALQSPAWQGLSAGR